MRVLNFGSLNMDYVYHVDHMVRPGETLSSQSMEVFLGGRDSTSRRRWPRPGFPFITPG